MSENSYDMRYVAQFVIEAKTPLNLSSGEKDALTDSLVMNDANGLPMIPGTSLCGVLRHAYAESKNIKQIIDDKKNNLVSEIDKIFGYQGQGNDGVGSRLIISNAHFIDQAGTVIEGLVNCKNEFFAKFAELPVREHTKISHKGATDASEHGKFDNQVVYKGTRFKFEIELIGNQDNDKVNWKELLSIFTNSTFRLGGGTRKGYGAIKLISAEEKTFDLNIPENLDAYLDKSSKLSKKLVNSRNILSELRSDNKNWQKYKLKLKPEDFYSFGSGFGDEDVDMTPVYEDIIEWDGNTAKFANKKILIPASSVKGAISHRVAFHYNKLSGIFADKIELGKIEEYVGEKNEAVKTLFGFAKNSNDNISGQRGNVILSDLFIDNRNSEKILNHVAIDRFTGGAMDGALFDEKVITQDDELVLDILVHKNALETDNVKEAFESTLDDIANGMLPLGGSTMRGHGSFSGTWEVK